MLTVTGSRMSSKDMGHLKWYGICTPKSNGSKLPGICASLSLSLSLLVAKSEGVSANSDLDLAKLRFAGYMVAFILEQVEQRNIPNMPLSLSLHTSDSNFGHTCGVFGGWTTYLLCVYLY